MQSPSVTQSKPVILLTLTISLIVLGFVAGIIYPPTSPFFLSMLVFTSTKLAAAPGVLFLAMAAATVLASSGLGKATYDILQLRSQNKTATSTANREAVLANTNAHLSSTVNALQRENTRLKSRLRQTRSDRDDARDHGNILDDIAVELGRISQGVQEGSQDAQADAQRVLHQLEIVREDGDGQAAAIDDLATALPGILSGLGAFTAKQDQLQQTLETEIREAKERRDGAAAARAERQSAARHSQTVDAGLFGAESAAVRQRVDHASDTSERGLANA